MKVTSNTTYAGNTQKSIDNTKFIPDDFKDIAESQEAAFAKLMINEMEKSIDRAEDKSTAEEVYEDFLVDERVKIMSKSEKGLGIKNLILDQIYPQRYRNQETYNAYQISQKGKK